MEMTFVDGSFRASFDLTDFGSAAAFRRICDEYQLSENSSYDGDGWEFIADDDSVVVHTYNHPISGEYARMERPKEPGYASYIHIEGEEATVRELYQRIRSEAEYVKDSALGTWIV